MPRFHLSVQPRGRSELAGATLAFVRSVAVLDLPWIAQSPSLVFRDRVVRLEVRENLCGAGPTCSTLDLEIVAGLSCHQPCVGGTCLILWNSNQECIAWYDVEGAEYLDGDFRRPVSEFRRPATESSNTTPPVSSR